MNFDSAEKTANTKWEKFVAFVRTHPKTGIAVAISIGVLIAWLA
jgi:ElaB/YqjD/DUF883 family membrane-anchored ribosome-binding protein